MEVALQELVAAWALSDKPDESDAQDFLTALAPHVEARVCAAEDSLLAACRKDKRAARAEAFEELESSLKAVRRDAFEEAKRIVSALYKNPKRYESQ